MKLPANVNPADPIAALIFAVLGLLGTFGVWGRLEMTADQVAELGAGAMVIAAIVRTWLGARKAVRP